MPMRSIVCAFRGKKDFQGCGKEEFEVGREVWLKFEESEEGFGVI
jgi:hypothetical protein